MSPHPLFEAAHAAPVIELLRTNNPVVHCLTNDVVTAFTANVLLAVGASPAMVPAREEAPGFAALADALLVNVGTIDSMSAESMLLSAESARTNGTPWVLDPVALGMLPYRAEIVAQLLRHGPSAIRANASEILALAGRESTAKGPDSHDSVLSALDAAHSLANEHGCVVAVTGETDFITDGSRMLAVEGGHISLTRITGTGCALSAMVAACLGSGHPDRLSAAAAALFMMKTAGRRASEHAGLGTFAVSLLDHLSFLGGPLDAGYGA